MTNFKSALLMAGFAAISGCEQPGSAPGSAPSDSADSSYVGAAACENCHENEVKLWQASHHASAMALPSEATVLGDFSNSTFEHNGVRSRFFLENGGYFVETDGPDGRLQTFPVIYTFGVHPLQQYLLQLPNDKIQALGIAWDTREESVGGQRWFHVYGDDPIDHNDVLHWTKLSQNWETMCADCHSTALESDYSLEDDRFDTRYQAVNVTCEACHGPGTRHVAWAETLPHTDDNGLSPTLAERQGIQWLLNPDTGNSSRSQPRDTSHEINTCAPCHSRRSRIGNDVAADAPFLDNYSPALITEPLYFADGQIRDEVYVYGSFQQSKMHANGVTCSDCHEPHSLNLRQPGAAVCGQCHDSNVFRTAAHQLHEDNSVNCIDCHMPATTYMQVDERNDHSFRIPRPALTVSHGIPNACGKCHTDKTPEWLATKTREAKPDAASPVGDSWAVRYTSALEQPQHAFTRLREIATDTTTPAIIRSSALSQTGFVNEPAAMEQLRGLLTDSNALVRLGAAQALRNSHPQVIAEVGSDVLKDPVAAVRLAAVGALMTVDPVMLPSGTHKLVQKGFNEFVNAQELNLERPEAHVNLGNLERYQGRPEGAEGFYLNAIDLGPSFMPAYVNLADLYRGWNREGDAESILRKALVLEPGLASLHHALGLSLVRQERLVEALTELSAAADAPDTVPRFVYVYAIALQNEGRLDEALVTLENGLEQFPGDPDLQNLLLQFRQL